MEILDSVYNEQEKEYWSKPKTLTHFVGGNGGTDLNAVEVVLRSGLQVREGWSDINGLLPNRPKGIFFWGEEMKDGGNTCVRIHVDVESLDASKLFAFPSALAFAANQAICGHELIEGCEAAMAAAQPVPYDEYEGAFAAEWIYVGDVDADAIKKGND